jgi:2-acylglycerol O-acyltransferase 2
LAITQGADIVPSYHFGSARVLRQLHSRFLRFLSRRLKFSLFLLVPAVFRPRIVQILGKPIHITKNPNPTQEEIDRVHEQVMSEMKRIFDDYKYLVGWQDRVLKII